MKHLVYKVFYIGNQVPFYLRRNKLQQKHNKVPEYYCQDYGLAEWLKFFKNVKFEIYQKRHDKGNGNAS